jgi:hypothetical protein
MWRMLAICESGHLVSLVRGFRENFSVAGGPGVARRPLCLAAEGEEPNLQCRENAQLFRTTTYSGMPLFGMRFPAFTECILSLYHVFTWDSSNPPIMWHNNILPR